MRAGRCASVRFADGSEIEAWTLVIATGVSYRLLDAPGLGDLSGRGVYYGASASQLGRARATTCTSSGAANSAGQAVLNLARYARRVTLLVRGHDARGEHVAVLRRAHHEHTERRSAVAQRDRGRRGDEHLEELTILDHGTGEKGDLATNWVFVFIGAIPRTEWLGDEVARDPQGFVLTGTDLVFDKGRVELATRSPALHARNEHAWCVRRRRRTLAIR